LDDRSDNLSVCAVPVPAAAAPDTAARSCIIIIIIMIVAVKGISLCLVIRI